MTSSKPAVPSSRRVCFFVDGRGSALSKMVGTVGIGLVLVETAAARAAVRGRLLLVQWEGRELGVTRKAGKKNKVASGLRPLLLLARV